MNVGRISERWAVVRTIKQTGRSSGRVVLFLGILLCPAALLRAQGVRYDNIVLGPRGGPLAGATIAVCSAGASTSSAPCSPLATIYSDEGLTQPLANPFLADSLGNYGFWAAPGHYIVQIYGVGISTKTMNVFLPCDPSNCSMASASISSISAGTLNLTGALTVKGRPVATEPLGSDAVLYVSPNGSDSNDGLSWGTAKQTLYAAVQATSSGGTIYVAANSACGGPVSGQGLWLYRTGSSPGTGWLPVNGLNIVGVGNDAYGANAPQPAVELNCGSATQPGLELENINASVHFENLIFSGSMGADLVSGVTTVSFDNVSFEVNDTVAGNGPAVFIGNSSFWLYFNRCVFKGNDNSGKATDGSDATESFVVNPGSGNNNSYLIFINESVASHGDIKFYGTGTTSWETGLVVNGLTTESQTDGKGAIWWAGGNAYGNLMIENVQVADATINPTPAVEVDSTSMSADAFLAEDVSGYGQNTKGPVKVLSSYGPNNGNLTSLPLLSGSYGSYDGRSFSQNDSARRTFPPAVSRFQNIAPQLPSSWALDGGVTLTSSVSAPDGTTNAGTVTNSNGYTAGARFYGSNMNLANGDYLIYGVWENGASNANIGLVSGASCTGVTLTQLLPSTQFDLTGATGEWEWVSGALKVSGSNSSCYNPFVGRAQGSGGSATFFAPVFYHVSAGVISDSEAALIALDSSSYPDSVTPPVEATLRGHPFAFGGSGDAYFATLDHSTLTANRTYLFPDTNGTVCLMTSCGGQVGQISISAATSGSHSFATSYNSTPVCVASPTSNPGSTTWWVTTTTTAVTVNVSASATLSFTYACFGNPD